MAVAMTEGNLNGVLDDMQAKLDAITRELGEVKRRRRVANALQSERAQREITAEAALVLVLISCGTRVHEDYRPGPREIEWARTQMAEAMHRMARPMPALV